MERDFIGVLYIDVDDRLVLMVKHVYYSDIQRQTTIVNARKFSYERKMCHRTAGQSSYKRGGCHSTTGKSSIYLKMCHGKAG